MKMMRVFGSLVPTLSRLSLTGVVPVLVLLTVSELIKTNLAIRSPLGVILDPEEDEDDFHSHGHDLGVIHSPISDSFRGSGFESFHSSGLDSISHLDPHIPSQGGCEPIKIGMCMELGYNETTMPNLVGHDAQADADALLQTFTPLIQYGCSPHLKLFLCSSHVPMCTEKTPQPIGPCRSLCESVRRKCQPVLTEFGFKWPPSLECSKFFPENNHQHMCIPGPMDTTHDRLGFRNPPGGGGGIGDWSSPSWNSDRSGTGPKNKFSVHDMDGGTRIFIDTPPGRKNKVIVHPSDHGFIDNGMGSIFDVPGKRGKVPEVVDNGPASCTSPSKFWSKGTCWNKCPQFLNGEDEASITLFKRSEIEFARNYTLPWAILTLFIATLALALTFRSPKLSTAERPLIYISFCQIMFALGTIIGTSLSISCFTDKTTGIELLAGRGTVPSPCALTFFLTYYFGTATNLWWVILCLSWLLSVNVNRRISLQQKERSLTHLLTWGTASVLTATALIYKKVDGDQLSGLCGIGFQDAEALTIYMLVPLGTTLSLGLFCLFTGLIFRFCPNWIPAICCFRLNKSQNTTVVAESAARQNHAYSPVLILPPPRSSFNFNSSRHHHHHHHHGLTEQDESPSFFTTNVQSANRFQRRRFVEDEQAAWSRIGIFGFVHILPLACQVGAIVYELAFRDSWENGQERPNLQIFLLRLNMSLIPGLTAGVWVLSTFSWKPLSSFSQNFCCESLRFFRPKNRELKVRGVSTGHGSQPESSVPTTSPLLIPVPVNSLATSYVTLGGGTNFTSQCQNHHRPFAGINTPRYHQPPLPPLPARNPDPIIHLDGWRRTETIV